MCSKETPYELPAENEDVVTSVRLPDLPVFDDSVIAEIPTA